MDTEHKCGMKAEIALAVEVFFFFFFVSIV